MSSRVIYARPIRLKVEEPESIRLEIQEGSFSLETTKEVPVQVFVVEQDDTKDITTALSTLTVTNFNNGDMIIIKNTDNIDTTGYVYNSRHWTAFNGNISADNVFFMEDIICAGTYTSVGNISKGLNDTLVLPADGKSLSGLMRSIFTKELQPTKTEPYASITLNQAGSYEVGTSITPTYTSSLSKGSYTYDSSTGVQATSYKAFDSNGNVKNEQSGSFSQFIVSDNTNYSITITIEHSEGNVATTNLGLPSDPAIKIESGSKTKKSSSITGYRKIFYGTLDNTNSITSQVVRSLTDGGKSSSKKITIKSNGNSNLKRFCVAIPTSSILKVTNVMKTDGLATDITSTYTKIGTTKVDGTNNANIMVDYDLWIYQPAVIDSAEVHEITIG